MPVTLTTEVPELGDVGDPNTIQQILDDLTNINDVTVLLDSWSSWTPVWGTTGTAPSLGNGTLIGRMMRVAPSGQGTQFIAIRLTWGSTTTGGTGSFQFGGFDGTPTTPSQPSLINMVIPALCVDDSATNRFLTAARLNVGTSTAISQMSTWNTTGTFGAVTATHPFTWATSDVLTVIGVMQVG
jgi:hypothetical protein